MTPVTIADLLHCKRQGRKIAMLTAYDFPMAAWVDASGVECVLVGDSLGMVVLGYQTTTMVTMEEMLHHAKAVRRGVTRALLIGDMPQCALEGTTQQVVAYAGRFVQEAGCNAVKVEWRPGMEEKAKAIITAGIPTMGHVGLTPQTVGAEGFGLRGKDAASAVRILEHALALEEAGCCAIVIECVPDRLAAAITQRLSIPTIGIGSGPACDGQVVVTHDLLGLFDRFTPRFVTRYANLAESIRASTAAFVQDVQAGRFPGTEQTPHMEAAELALFEQALARGPWWGLRQPQPLDKGP